MRPFTAAVLSIAFSTGAWGVSPMRQAAPPSVIGRWDITLTGTSGTMPAWLEVIKSGNSTLVGRFVGWAGSARPISRVDFTNNVVSFSIPPQWEAGKQDLHLEGTLAGDKMSGWLTDPGGNKLTWTAVRAPALRRTAPPTWGAPIALFNGSDLSAWQTPPESQWRVIDHVLTNTKPGINLVTRAKFVDFKLHVEFRYPKDGNSGVFLRGRYEAQIEDSEGIEAASIHLGGIYGFLPPNENAAKKFGEWQSYDITIVGRIVTVVLNGKTVIANQEIPGITGGALDSNEGQPGPIYLQGDHGPVEFRNIVLTPAK